MLLGSLLNKLFNRRSAGDGSEANDLWLEWNERRMAAMEAGQPFDEPAPAPGQRRGRGRRRGRSNAADAAAGAFLVGPPIDHHFSGHDGGGGGFGGGGDAGGGF